MTTIKRQDWVDAINRAWADYSKRRWYRAGGFFIDWAHEMVFGNHRSSEGGK